MSDQYENIRRLPFGVLAPALDIDLQRFQRRKKEWVGPCPVHKPKKNTACFRYADDGRYHCFSCEAKGKGAIDLAKGVKEIGFAAAVDLLQPLASQLKEKPPGKADSEATEPSSELKPYTGKYEKFKVPCPWLEQRIPNAQIREKFGVFCYDNPARKSAYSGRVMIPVKDVQGQLYGYLGRAIEGDNVADVRQTEAKHTDIPKYLFPKDLPKTRFLFGAHELCTFGQLPLKRVYLVESPFCVMKFASMGLPAVSPFGWSVSESQIAILSQLAKGVVFLPDRNKRTEAESVVAELSEVLWLRFPKLPADISDPEQLSRQQVLDLCH